MENSVGELTANPHRLSAKCQYPGKRAWRAPTPNFEKPRGREIAGFFAFFFWKAPAVADRRCKWNNSAAECGIGILPMLCGDHRQDADATCGSVKAVAGDGDATGLLC